MTGMYDHRLDFIYVSREQATAPEIYQVSIVSQPELVNLTREMSKITVVARNLRQTFATIGNRDSLISDTS